jgi:hypothetical protein
MKNDIKDIPGYEGLYQADTKGNIYGRRFRKPLKQQKHQDYVWVGLYSRDGKRKVVSVHRLVALTFLPNPDNKPTVNHKDGDKLNNQMSNLEWATHSENIFHAVNKLGMNRGERQGNNKLTVLQVQEIVALRDSMTAQELADKYGVHKTNVQMILRGDRWNWLTKIKRKEVLYAI